MKRIFIVSYLVVVAFFALQGSGVIPPVIPQLAPVANKQGNSTKFQLAGTNSNTNGNVLCNDANGNATDSGCSGAAVATPFSSITTGSNVTAAMTCGAGCSILTTSTGTIVVTGIRNYTVATLPSATAGSVAYVTDGTGASDCTVGGSSTKVLCLADGASWAAVGGGASGSAGGALSGSYPNPVIKNIAFTSSVPCIPFASGAGIVTCGGGSGGSPYNIFFNDTAGAGGAGVLTLRGGLVVDNSSTGNAITFRGTGNGLAFSTSTGSPETLLRGGANNVTGIRCSETDTTVIDAVGVCAIGTAPGTNQFMLDLLGPNNSTFGAGGVGIGGLRAVGGKGSAATDGQNGGPIVLTTGAGGDGGTSNGSGADMTFNTGIPGAGAGTAGINGAIILKIGGSERYRLDAQGHTNTSGTAPSLSSCGSSPSIVGDDGTGTVTVGGGGVVTACTLTFDTTWNAAPACVLTTSSTTGLSSVSAVSATAVTFTFAADLAGGNVYYQCRSHR